MQGNHLKYFPLYIYIYIINIFSKTVDISSLIDHFQELINKKVFKEITDFDVVGYYGDYLNLTQNKKMNSQLKKLSETLSEQNIDHNYLSYIDEF